MFGIVASGLIWFVWDRNVVEQTNAPTIVHSQEKLQERYDYLLHHAVKTNIHPLFRPVHFRIGDKFGASGTLMLDKDGNPYRIITANHLFSETQPGSDYYDYMEVTSNGYTNLGHLSKVVLDSIRQSPDRLGIEDIAIGYIGTPGLITRTSQVLVSAQVGNTSEVRVGKISPVTVTSLDTGEKFEIVGQAVNDKNVVIWIMLYESVNGESGSGYWGDDGRLYILSGTVMVTSRLRKDLGIPSRFRYVTLMSAVKIDW